MALPLTLLFGSWVTFVDADGAQLALGSLEFFEAGTVTPLPVFGDSDGMTSLGAVVALNASGQPSDGMAPTGVYLSPTGYKLKILDVDSNVIYTQDNIEDVGAAFLSDLGEFLSTGQKSATSPYTVTANDNFISIAGGTVLLQPVNDRTQQLIIQNTSTTVTTAVTPNGAENINGVASAFVLQVATAAPKLPAITLLPYPASGGYLVAATAFVTP
jgi:hypothetical protein